jgi:DeoR family glycerol-3-phosphate regulon repressor
MVEQGHISQVDCLVCDKTPPASISKIIKENNITFVKA